jgi:hypothetical protein
MRVAVGSQPRQIVHETLSQVYPIQKPGSGVAEVIECLPSKCEALSSNSSTTKKDKTKYCTGTKADTYRPMEKNNEPVDKTSCI